MSIKKYLALAVMKLVQLFPVKSNRVVFTSFYGTYYNDIPRMISDQISDKNYDIYWIVNKGVTVPANIKTVKPETVKELYILSTSKVWVDNSRKNFWVRKKKKQVYFQTWHGSVCLKAIEADAPLLNPSYVEKAKNDSKMINYLLSQCKWRTNNFRNCFWYDGDIIEGDTVSIKKEEEKDTINKVRRYYELDEKENIALYAPTFRSGKNSFSCYNLDCSRLKKALEMRFGGKWVVIFRLHPNIAYLQSNLSIPDVLDGTSYPKIEDLVLACNVLITDYSGCLFDGLKRNKFVFLFATDFEEYINKERHLYFNLNAFPSPLALSNDELIKNILDINVDSYYLAVDKFNAELGYYKDDGIQLVSDKIVSILDDKH